MKKATILLLALLAFPPVLAGTARGQSNGDLSQVEILALNNFHHEMTTCIAYFNIVSEGLNQRGDEEPAAAFLRASDVLLERTFVIGRKIGMKDEAAMARLRMEANDQLEAIDRNMINISILIEKHADVCKSISDDPDSRLLFWLDKAAVGSSSPRHQRQRHGPEIRSSRDQHRS